MSEIEVDCDASADTLCDRALEVVAKRGWLSKHSWSVSKAVHAFTKPIRVVLAAETPADVVQQLLLRSPIVAVRLEGSVDAPDPLPGGLHELILSESFCGSLATLPDTLHSFEASFVENSNSAAQQSVLQLIPGSLQRLRVNHSCLRYWERDCMVAALPALPNLTVLCLQGVEWSTSLPPCLQELCLSGCTVSDELQLPATLQKLELAFCRGSSSSSSDANFAAHLTAILQHVVIRSDCSVDIGSQLPSTLTHLVLDDRSSASPGVLPSGLQHLELNRKLSEPVGVLPSTLEVLRLGWRYTQPLGVEVTRPVPGHLRHPAKD